MMLLIKYYKKLSCHRKTARDSMLFRKPLV